MATQYGDPSPTPTLHPSSSVPSSGLLKEKESEGKLSGFIFLCNGQTKPECYRYRVFGLPNGQVDVVEKIEPGTILFLFDFGVKRLYGIYAATSKGGMNLEPAAFSGKFQAQVRFKILSDSLPLHEQAFKHAIKDNYQGSKFRQELSGEQVKALVSLFQPINISPSVSLVPAATDIPVAHTFATPRPNEKYTPETYARKHVQAAPNRIIQQSPLPLHSYPKYLAEAPTLYLPEKATLSTYDPNRSYEIALEMDRRNRVNGLYSQLYAPTLPNSRSTVDLVNYNSQYLPPASTSHVSQQPQAMASTLPNSRSTADLVNYNSQYLPPASTSHVSLQPQAMASTLPSSRSTVDLVNYNSQYLPPATTSHVSLQPQAMAPMYTVATSPHLQASPLLRSHQSHYPPPTHVGESQVYHDPSHQSYYPRPTHVGENQAYLDPLQSSIHGSSGVYPPPTDLQPHGHKLYYTPPTHVDQSQVYLDPLQSSIQGGSSSHTRAQQPASYSNSLTRVAYQL